MKPLEEMGQRSRVPVYIYLSLDNGLLHFLTGTERARGMKAEGIPIMAVWGMASQDAEALRAMKRADAVEDVHELLAIYLDKIGRY